MRSSSSPYVCTFGIDVGVQTEWYPNTRYTYNRLNLCPNS
eukprot:SAG11_NODE_9703_length_888_cov_0.964512_1_plen_39_part_10